jgi:hypothetical protein
MPQLFEENIYMRHRLDRDDNYIGRSNNFERRQSEHWRLFPSLPLVTILETVKAPTKDAARRLAQATESSWRNDFAAIGIGPPKELITGELMPTPGVYKRYFPKRPPDPVRNELAGQGFWINDFGAPLPPGRRAASPPPLSYELPPGVTECPSNTALDEFRAAHPDAWVLGLRDWWRIEPASECTQKPDTGSRIFGVPSGSRGMIGALVKVLLRHPMARRNPRGQGR